jgi:hypothetical protein
LKKNKAKANKRQCTYNIMNAITEKELIKELKAIYELLKIFLSPMIAHTRYEITETIPVNKHFLSM